MTDEKQPFFSHLKELRDRLVVSIIAIAVAFIITYYFKETFRFSHATLYKGDAGLEFVYFYRYNGGISYLFQNIGCCCPFPCCAGYPV